MKDKWTSKLMKRWGVQTPLQVVLILIVFALTGMSAVYAKKPIFQWLDINSSTPNWIRAIVWLITILPLYNILLLIYGFVFGQFEFFWNFEKKFFRRLNPFKKKSSSSLKQDTKLHD